MAIEFSTAVAKIILRCFLWGQFSQGKAQKIQKFKLGSNLTFFQKAKKIGRHLFFYRKIGRGTNSALHGVYEIMKIGQSFGSFPKVKKSIYL